VSQVLWRGSSYTADDRYCSDDGNEGPKEKQACVDDSVGSIMVDVIEENLPEAKDAMREGEGKQKDIINPPTDDEPTHLDIFQAEIVPTRNESLDDGVNPHQRD
jgi:hypothetical protein